MVTVRMTGSIVAKHVMTKEKPIMTKRKKTLAAQALAVAVPVFRETYGIL